MWTSSQSHSAAFTKHLLSENVTFTSTAIFFVTPIMGHRYSYLHSFCYNGCSGDYSGSKQNIFLVQIDSCAETQGK